MSHIPINHPLRPLYRVLAGIAGLYLLAFGVLGFLASRGLDTFAQSGTDFVLGMRANPAFSILSVLTGAAILAGVVVGRNLYYVVSFGVGGFLTVLGLAMMTLLRTDANFLGFSMANVIITMIIGMLLLTAALYGKVDDSPRTRAEPARSH